MKQENNIKKATLLKGTAITSGVAVALSLLIAAYSTVGGIAVSNGADASLNSAGEDITSRLLPDGAQDNIQAPDDFYISGTTSADETLAGSLESDSIDSDSIESGAVEPARPVTPEALDLRTQEGIAAKMSRYLNLSARAGTKISYPYPSGAMAVTLYLDGKHVLKGQVADIGGTVYVPVQRFADMFGYQRATYDASTETVEIYGKNLHIKAQVGLTYITVNDRIFYTGKKVLSLGGWIFAPLESMTRAFGATVKIRSGYYDASITSGDPTSVKWASEYYNSTDLYWLSRIISAEAKGEVFAGQIAVGNVVLNRVRSSQFPNTVKGVIFDKKYGVQFSPVSSGTIYDTPTDSAVLAAKICLEGYTLSSRALYFFNPKIATSSWIARTRPYIMTIGNHKFYA